jgi:hypothetical protein
MKFEKPYMLILEDLTKIIRFSGDDCSTKWGSCCYGNK